MIKRLSLFSILFFFALRFNASSQDIFPMSIGLFVSGKGCVNTVDPPQGIKNDFQISPLPDIGVAFYYPFSSERNFGIIADLSYLTTAFKYKLYNNSSINWRNEFHYFNIGVGTYLSGFFLSLNLGIPLSGKGSYMNSSVVNFDTKDLNTIFQLRVGGAIPLVQDEVGRLNLLIYGDYSVNGSMANDNNFNPRIASLSLGLSYLFNFRK